MKSKILFGFFLSTLPLLAEEGSPPQLTIEQISEAMGHLIGKNLQSIGLPFDLQAVVKGMQDAAEGKSAPIEEETCIQAIALLQEDQLNQAADENLQKASAFLRENRSQKGIVSLEEGKLQYRIEKTGTGEKVQPHHNPIVRYQARFLNGEPITHTQIEEVLSLQDAIPGFQKGLLGMQEGESRTLFIHPDLGYGSKEELYPNALLIFEVEIVKADVSQRAHAQHEETGQPRLLCSEKENLETETAIR